MTKHRRTQTSHLKLRDKRKEPSNCSLSDLLSNFQPVAHVPSSFILSQNIPLLKSHSPSMLREKLLCCCSGNVNTVKEVSPATLSSPNTHPSFLGTEGPLPCGSLMPPVRAPSPLGKERPLHLTNFAQRLQERDYRHCARDTPKQKYPHFLPFQRRCCPTQGFFGQPCLHTTPESGGESLSDRRVFSSAVMCRPKISLFSVEMQGPNSINSLRTIGSFIKRKKKSSPCGPYFLGTFRMRGSCA